MAEVAVNPPDPKSGGAAAIADAGITNAACPFAIRKLSGEAAEMLQLVRTSRSPRHTPLLSSVCDWPHGVCVCGLQDTLPSPFITLSSRHVCQLQDKEVFDFVGLLSYVGDPHVVSTRTTQPKLSRSSRHPRETEPEGWLRGVCRR